MNKEFCFVMFFCIGLYGAYLTDTTNLDWLGISMVITGFFTSAVLGFLLLLEGKLG